MAFGAPVSDGNPVLSIPRSRSRCQGIDWRGGEDIVADADGDVLQRGIAPGHAERVLGWAMRVRPEQQGPPCVGW